MVHRGYMASVRGEEDKRRIDLLHRTCPYKEPCLSTPKQGRVTVARESCHKVTRCYSG